MWSINFKLTVETYEPYFIGVRNISHFDPRRTSGLHLSFCQPSALMMLGAFAETQIPYFSNASRI
ncbi:hypothetical protein BD289DRAFT_436924 [Coniella lustricola]|uniref:Uncharacterized protein n=1 Tax=Coniella lustricola TaxID=2025994 RepID=A0A2T3A4L2_9PEZI|nr:hypothetical protein BD289DRAFT_436924 [Coniella lustricola]